MKSVTHCQTCGKLLPQWQREGSKFCSVECKDKFWALQRKADRAANRVKAALDELLAIAAMSDYLYEQTFSKIESACFDANKLIAVNVWACSQCGQLRYSKPLPSDACPFCNHQTFNPVRK